MSTTETAPAAVDSPVTWVQEDIPENEPRATRYDAYVDHLVGNAGTTFRCDPGASSRTGEAPKPGSVKAGIERSALRYKEMGFVTVSIKNGVVRAFFTAGSAPEKAPRKSRKGADAAAPADAA